MSILIHAAMTASIEVQDGPPSEIVYLPEGEHTIMPWVNGKPKKVTVKVPAEKGEAIAAVLQAALDGKKEKDPIRAWFDFNHKSDGPASAFPTGFRYEPGKGIMASVEWTGSGGRSIVDRDYSYLSPTFLIGDDGLPSGLPDRGPLAALVNEPAFREIPRIAASDAAVDHDPTNPPTMSKLIFAALAISAAAENAEPEAVKAIEALKVEAADAKQKLSVVEAENIALKAKVDAAEADTKAANAKRLDAKVEAAVAAGKIAAKDDETKKEVRELLEASEALGDKAIASMPVKFADLDKAVVTAGQAKGADASDKFEGKTGVQLLEAALAEEFDAAK